MTSPAPDTERPPTPYPKPQPPPNPSPFPPPGALVPNLLAAANAAGNLVRHHQYEAGGHLMDSYGVDDPGLSAINRRLAEQHAMEAYAARIERRHLFAAYRAGFR